MIEGATRLVVPRVNERLVGPGRREKGEPFYNPGMALNRDLSVLIAAAEAVRRGREIDFADALAGTGARSARVANEVQAPLLVHANDANPAAIAAIRKTAHENALDGRLLVTEGDAAVFLASRRFDVVDLDPHGSPMPFLDGAVRATRHDGLVCVTATDTGALAGTYPRVCKRRYGAHHGLHAMPWRAEVGLRILAGAIVRSAARFDRGAHVELSVCRGHWMRVVARIRDGSQQADQALAQVGDAEALPTGAGGFLEPHAPRPPKWAGPLWTGPLHDKAFVAALVQARGERPLARSKEIDALMPILAAEATAPPFWVVPDALQQELGPPPRRDVLMQRLAASGHAAARSHMDPQGIRTDAGMEALAQAWKPRA
jgi:tRNA (guanine26-N2/guanine27-N2)-dimethyltransferase